MLNEMLQKDRHPYIALMIRGMRNLQCCQQDCNLHGCTYHGTTTVPVLPWCCMASKAA